MNTIKDLRRKSKDSQSSLAKYLGVSIRTVQYYESGKVEIPRSKVADIAKKYNVSISHIYGDDSASVFDFNDKSIMRVPLVNKYAYAGYQNGGFGDYEYIEELPKIPFVNDVEPKGEYMCFEVKGDSMDDESYQAFLEGDILLCRNISPDHWQNKLHINKWDFVVVHKEHGILVKRITEHLVSKGIITLHSLNDYYEDFDVHLQDVQKLFNIVDFRRKKNRR